ncbi:MAG: hypothetical protein HGA25_11560, partial [Clostridiales bacterium]|nr:hypothetical protein [Clostridiales bacterium]
AYLHGVSDGMLDYLLHPFSWLSHIYLVIRDVVSMFIFFCLSLFFLLFDQSTALHHLLRASARFGRIMSEIHLEGAWSSVQSWETTHK